MGKIFEEEKNGVRMTITRVVRTKKGPFGNSVSSTTVYYTGSVYDPECPVLLKPRSGRKFSTAEEAIKETRKDLEAYLEAKKGHSEVVFDASKGYAVIEKILNNMRRVNPDAKIKRLGYSADTTAVVATWPEGTYLVTPCWMWSRGIKPDRSVIGRDGRKYNIYSREKKDGNS